MYSVGELIDRLIIEDIKVFNLRETVHNKKISKKEKVLIFNKLNIFNNNKAILVGFLDTKINNILDGKEKNQLLKIIKTY